MSNGNYYSGGSPYNTMGVRGGGAGGFGAKIGGIFASQGATLIPILISMGLDFFSSRKSSNNLMKRSQRMMNNAMMRESKYTGGIEEWLEGKQDEWNRINDLIFSGVPKTPTREKVFGPKKDYGFTFEPGEPEEPMTNAKFNAMTTEEKRAWVDIHGPWHYG